MKTWLDFNECLKDSPKFRAILEEQEHSIHALESHLEKLIKISSQVFETGKAYSHALGSLINNFDSLATLFHEDRFVSSPLKKLNNVLGELQTHLMLFLEHTQKCLTHKIHRFIKEDIRKVKDTKKYYDKISVDLDSARLRNSQLLKTCKPSDSDEAENVLTATLSCFNHTALDYTCLINDLQSKRRFYILGQVVSFLDGHYTYHKQGCESLSKFESFQSNLSSQLEELHGEYTSDCKEMEDRHSLVHEKTTEYENLLNQTLPRNKNNIIMDGYLFKRSSNAFKTWNRRWFVIQNNKLCYTKRSKSDAITEMVDLRLSTVKHATDCDRRFTFAVVSPTKCWYLQADSDKLKERWMSVMQMAIARALHDSDSRGDHVLENNLEKLHPQYLLAQIRELPGNEKCVDCGGPNPKWASINLGIILCIECSGIHRSLGVHITKVRSITLDDWDPESVKLMLGLGNEIVNEIYEANLPSPSPKPTKSSTRGERESWVHAKYVEKKFVKKHLAAGHRLRRRSVRKKLSDGKIHSYALEKSGEECASLSPTPPITKQTTCNEEGKDGEPDPHPNMLLYESAKCKSVSTMALALANGADVNWRNYEASERTALHETVVSGCVTTSEYLLQNGANINVVDAEGRTPLHYAAHYAATSHMCLFLKRDADQHAVDKKGHDALNIALENTHADIVTLLRLARLHEEIKETDVNMGGDETVTDVFRDFSNMGSRNPEKLRREKFTDV